MPAPHPRPWHRNSLFAAGPRHPLTREERAKFQYLVRLHHGAGRLTRAAKDVAGSLLRRLAVDGRCDPSHDTIAGDALCSARTVRRSLASLRGCGLLFWQRRIARCRDGRIEQTSNQYWLSPSAAAPAPEPCGQEGRQIPKIKDKTAFEATPGDAATVREALAAVRKMMEARLAAARANKGN
jgi:hypothetical protein